MVDEAYRAGADAIKFQTYISENFLSASSEYFDFFKNVEISFEEFKEIKNYADNVGITFFSTPFDFESADYLNKINTPAFKIASSDLTNLPLLSHISKMNVPMIISTGLATMDEIQESLDLCNSVGNYNISILHSVSDYPTKPEEANLSVIPILKEKFQIPIGYSDNGESILVDEVAVSLGADIIEKHFTLDKKMPGPDHSFSIQPNDLSNLISKSRLIEKILGHGTKTPSNSELNNIIAIRKSITSSKIIQHGDIFSFENLSLKRPGTGLEPKYWNKIIGKKSKRVIQKDELIKSEDFN
jgi:sialic acid synthase SpsE